MIDVPGVKLEHLRTTAGEATFSVVVDGNDLGRVAFLEYYGPRAASLGPYVAVWAGPTLYVVDRQHGTMRRIDRNDETHRIHLFGETWIVEGELNVDLFDPGSGTTLATYGHNEVIVDTVVARGFVHVEDFAGATVTLDPRRSLRVVSHGPASADQMYRLAISLLSVLLAYATCVVSGVNRWLYMWLKSFYAPYVVSMWVSFTVLFTLYGMRRAIRNSRWIFIGPAVGYLAGAIAYQLAPVIRDGSFARGAATMAIDGVATYAGVSALYPLLCLAPVIGLIAAAILTILSRASDRSVAVGVVAVVFVVGWSFFLSRGVLPVRW
ncbi:MAG TPA: hypothetical protein VGF28_16980 [Thermoanaerobaculia bacterium]|jgi:hypothetical protein